MKRTNKIRAIALLFIIFTANCSWAYDFSDTNFSYNIISEMERTCSVAKAKDGLQGNVTIPEKLSPPPTIRSTLWFPLATGHSAASHL